MTLKASNVRSFTNCLVCLIKFAAAANSFANELPTREITCPSPIGMTTFNRRSNMSAAVSFSGAYATKSLVISKIESCVSSAVSTSDPLKKAKYWQGLAIALGLFPQARGLG